MLYWVPIELHPSHLQRVFSFIIFIKERYSFTILSENSRAPGGVPWAELKSHKHLCDCQQNTEICCSFTYHLQFRIMTTIFYRWDRSIFSIKWCANPASNWALFIKHSSPKEEKWAPEKCPYKFCISVFHDVIKGHAWQILSETYTNPEGVYLAQKNCHTSKSFSKLWHENPTL